MSRVENILTLAEQQATDFIRTIKAAQTLADSIHAQGYDTDLNPAYITGQNLEIANPNPDTEARQLEAHNRLAGGLAAYRVVIGMVSAPLTIEQLEAAGLPPDQAAALAGHSIFELVERMSL